jgi:cyanobactin maturation PatA/PatG family protease
MKAPSFSTLQESLKRISSWSAPGESSAWFNLGGSTINNLRGTARATDVVTLAGLKELWTETLGDPRISIAVLDGPVDRSHPSLAAANLTELPTLVSGTPDRGPASQHGTHVASVIFGQHDAPVKGIAPRCRGLIVPIFKDGPDDSLAGCSQIDLARAITQAVEAGAHLVNISAGQFSPSGVAHPILADVVQSCCKSGVLLVTAAGNQGCDCQNVPGASPSVLAVGAMNSKGEPMEFSNWGAAYRTQGVLAPGENILGALAGGGTATQSGTSYAAAIVSGVAALFLSLRLKRGLKPDAHAVRKVILANALGCDYQKVPDCRRVLAGRLNIAGSLAHITKGEDTMADQTDMKENGRPLAAAGMPSDPDAHQSPADRGGAAASERAGAGSFAAPPPSTATRDGLEKPEVTAAGAVDPGQVTASACGCSGGRATPAQLVFALGQLGYDFGTEARRDSITQHMKEPANPYDSEQLLAYLQENPWDAASIIWTLNLDATPIYAVQPQGAFAREIGERLAQFLKEQLSEGVERVSIPGWIAGSARLLTGQVVPVIHPVIRGMYSWTTRALVEAVAGKPPPENAAEKDKESYPQKTQAVANFLERVYYELRNLGVSPQERATNFAATNAFNLRTIFQAALADKMELDAIEVERSPVCRPDSDCWDVKLLFFYPERQVQTVERVYRFTIDVSDVVPVTVGPVRSWFVR